MAYSSVRSSRAIGGKCGHNAAFDIDFELDGLGQVQQAFGPAGDVEAVGMGQQAHDDLGVAIFTSCESGGHVQGDGGASQVKVSYFLVAKCQPSQIEHL